MAVVLSGFGTGDLSRSLQSLPEFMKCPYSVSIGGYLLISFSLKMAGCFGLAVLFYTLAGSLPPLFAYLISGTLVVGELAAGLLISPVSSLRILRYLNLLTLIHCEEYYLDCHFFDFSGNVSEALGVSIWFMAVMLTVCFLAGFFIFGKGYGPSRSGGEKILDLCARIREKLSKPHSLFYWEGYKLLIKQKGLLILIVVAGVHFSLSWQYEYYYPVDMYERMWYEQFRGELTKESLEKAERSMGILKSAEERMKATLAELQQMDPIPSEQYRDISMALETNRQRQKGLAPLLEDMQTGMEYQMRMGHRTSVVAPYYYDLLLNRDVRTRTRASFLSIVAILGVLSGIFAFERQNHVRQLMSSTFCGRGKITMCKWGMTAVFSSLCCGALHLVQLLCVGRVDSGFPDLEKPVQSIIFLRNFGLYVPVWVYLVLLFLVRMGMACLLGFIAAGISLVSEDVVTAIGLSAFLVILLVLLGEIIPGGEWISPLFWLDGTYFR